MKAWDFEAVAYDGDEYCVGCLPDGVDVDDDDVCPIFASDEVDVYPVCCVCGCEHDYMSKIEYEDREGKENVDDYLS